jgi:hypothetical protein
MPTAAKLVAALAFFATGFLAAEAFKPGMPEGTQFGAFSLMVGAIGALTGWMVSGPLAGRGYGNSIGTGLRTAATLTFWALLLFSGWVMIDLALKMRYDGPMDALVGVFALMLEHGQLVLTAPVLTALGAGGVVGGILVESSARRWR